jgi:hypothetical protein
VESLNLDPQNIPKARVSILKFFDDLDDLEVSIARTPPLEVIDMSIVRGKKRSTLISDFDARASYMKRL